MSSATASGDTSVPLLDQTIGQNLADTVRRFGDSDALIVPFQDVRLTYTEFARKSTRWRARPARRRPREGRPRRHLESEQRRVGARAVRDRAGRRDSREHQPRVPDARGEVRARAVRLPLPDLRDGVQDERLPRDDRRGPRRPARPRTGRVPRQRTTGASSSPRAKASPTTSSRRVPATLDRDDAINIQYTSGTTGFPKGATLSHRNLVNNGFFVGEGCGYTEADRVCIPRALLPLLRHGARQPRVHDARRRHGGARAGVRARGHAPDRAGRAVHQLVWRADDVHRRARARRLRGVRPLVVAHRDHGRFAVSGRDHEAVRRQDAHGRGHHRLRHDGDVARVDPDGRGRSARQARRLRRPSASACRDRDRRSREGDHRRLRRARRAVHAGLLGDARLLERSRAHRGSHRRRRVDAHRRPRRHGRRGLRRTSSDASRTW